MCNVSGGNLTCHLLEFQDDKLRWFQWREANDDINDTLIDIILGRCFAIAFDKVSLFWRFTLECTLSKQVIHKRAQIQPNLRPQRLIIWFKHDHCVPRYRLSCKNSASLRTGIYFHSEARRSSPAKVRDPQTMLP